MGILEQDALFVTGTDTGVGKTVCSAAVARAWQDQGHEVCAIKAVAAGGKRSRSGEFFCEDSDVLHAACTDAGRRVVEETLGQSTRSPIVGVMRPMAPWSASLLDGTPLDLKAIRRDVEKLRRACAKRRVKFLVEGAGGAMVPLSAKKTVADLIAESRIPALIVGRTELGTINHTLMTIEVLRARGITIAGLVLSRQRRGALTVVENASIEEIQLFLPRGIDLRILPHAKDAQPRLPV